MDILLRGEYGSRAYGTNTEFSDHDTVEVVVEHPKFITGLETFETIQGSTSGEGNRSTKDDTDTTTYGLQKFTELAVLGNPTILGVLYLPKYDVMTRKGGWLLVNRDLFISKSAGRRFSGYMSSQRDAMTGLRNKRTNRPELVHEHGFDSKFAYHMIRLGLLGKELMDTGTIQLPMKQEIIDICMTIREGRMSKEEVLTLSYELEADLETAIHAADLPEYGQRDKVSELLHNIYTDVWENGVG
jgi:predicted nucleotidyltransferase